MYFAEVLIRQYLHAPRLVGVDCACSKSGGRLHLPRLKQRLHAGCRKLIYVTTSDQMGRDVATECYEFCDRRLPAHLSSAGVRLFKK